MASIRVVDFVRLTSDLFFVFRAFRNSFLFLLGRRKKKSSRLVLCRKWSVACHYFEWLGDSRRRFTVCTVYPLYVADVVAAECAGDVECPTCAQNRKQLNKLHFFPSFLRMRSPYFVIDSFLLKWQSTPKKNPLRKTTHKNQTITWNKNYSFVSTYLTQRVVVPSG